MCVYVCLCMRATACVCRSGDNFVTFVLFFHLSVGSGNPTQVAKLGHKPLSHLTGPRQHDTFK